MEQKQNPVVQFTMEDGGVMTAELYPDKAPNTVANFVDLVRSGFYDGLGFHRIIEGFMIQGGSASGDCAGGGDFTIVGEFAANGVDTGLQHDRGTLSMARSMNPNSASTQFFIMHQNSPHLDGQYAAFGKLTGGFDVLDRIATTPTLSASDENRPVTPQIVKTVKVLPEDYESPAPKRKE